MATEIKLIYVVFLGGADIQYPTPTEIFSSAQLENN